MDIEIHELRPAAVTLVLGTSTLTLRAFTLDDEVWAIENFGSTNRMGELAASGNSDKGLVLFKVIWHLLAHKGEWPLYSDFETYLLGMGKAFVVKQSGTFYDALRKTLINSAPLIKNVERMKILAKQAEALGAKAPSYVSYYDKLARTYGFTLEQFYNLTLRQLHLLLNGVQEGDYSALEIQAALAGRKLQPRVSVDLNVTPEQEADQEVEAKEAHKRLMQDYLDKKGVN